MANTSISGTQAAEAIMTIERAGLTGAQAVVASALTALDELRSSIDLPTSYPSAARDVINNTISYLGMQQPNIDMQLARFTVVSTTPTPGVSG